MQQLSGVDAGFLNLETSSTFGHVSSLSIYDRPADPDFDAYEVTRAQIDSRLASLEPFRRRLVEVPLGLDHPWWIHDPDFDLDFHVRHIAAPPPGDTTQLTALVARIIGRPMDRGRPLWEGYVIEGLQNDQFALLTKVHHATIDGAAGAELLAMMLDHSPDGDTADAEPDEWKPEREPSSLEMLGRTMLSIATRPLDAFRLASHTASSIREVSRRRGIGGLGELVGTTMPGRLSALARREHNENDPDIAPVLPSMAAPPTPWNRSITPHRRFSIESISLTDVKDTKRLLGCTVNDVVMAMVAGGLRRWLIAHDALPDDPLVAMVPVSVRTGDESEKWTNRVSSLFVPIPTHEAEPLDRVAAMNRTMNEAKATFDLLPADVLTDLAQFSPPALATRAARLAARLHIGDRVNAPINLVISNVPGPREPLYLGGAMLQHYYPVSTIVEGAGLNVTVQSYLDNLDFGLVACRELIPELDEMTGMITAELDVLRNTAETVTTGS
ncbi:MAG: wax ester/triacylglycerol synthase family O-acyltransferase [Acidimicrobiia bacterium]|nr:wax ester/triacylglycerol synthase family O-acyltransferase [Acidimicrobiia bacterium]